MDQTLIPNAPLASSPGAVGLVPNHTNNPMGQDMVKPNPFAFENMQNRMKLPSVV
tara:strand:+ start:153 stop:317 length:165 start_codon:yes stop_codon:yes gene_type:complete